MAAYKVTYFQSKGNAEIMRLALFVAGQDFVDERLDKEQWLELKPNTPAKQMPLLTVTENGKETVYCQSSACAKYLAKKFGLYGSSPAEELLLDEVFECMMDAIREVVKVLYEQDEVKKAEIKKKVCEEALPRLNDYINLRKSQYGKNGFIIGPKMTLVDLHLYNVVDQTSAREEGLWDSFPDILKHAQLIKSDKKVAEWIERMPKSQV